MIARKFRLPSRDTRRTPEMMLRFPLFVLKVFRSESLQKRVGVIVGKHVCKKATDRHLWKRRFYALAAARIAGGGDYLFVATPQLDSSNFKMLKEQIDKAFAKVNNK